MSLDKWLKTGKKDEKVKKEPEVKKKAEPIKKPPPKKDIGKKEPLSEKPTKEPIVEPQPKKLIKYVLSCPKKSCNYQKIKVKKELLETDKICPRCKSQMKVKEA